MFLVYFCVTVVWRLLRETALPATDPPPVVRILTHAHTSETPLPLAPALALRLLVGPFLASGQCSPIVGLSGRKPSYVLRCSRPTGHIRGRWHGLASGQSSAPRPAAAGQETSPRGQLPRQTSGKWTAVCSDCLGGWSGFCNNPPQWQLPYFLSLLSHQSQPDKPTGAPHPNHRGAPF